jgi:DNA-binding MarR family transcriptional regulator
MLGQAVALAQRALTGLLDDVLAQAGTDQQTWFTLSRITSGRSATGGPAQQDNRTRVVRDDLARAFGTGGDHAAGLLDRLGSQGLLATGQDEDPSETRVMLTPEGEARYRELLDAIQAANACLTEPFDASDLETTTRTLQAVTSRAQAIQPRLPGTANS